MAGPTVRVLVQSPTPSVVEAVRHSVTRLGGREESRSDSVGIELRDEADLPYGVEIEPWPPAEDEGLAEEVVAAIGFRPTHDIVLIAFVNDEASHRFLGRLALDLARTMNGWIDLGGALTNRTPASAHWSLADVRQYAGGLRLGGQLRTVEHDTASGRRWATHVLDADALAAWLAHPHFHLIK